MAGLSAIDRRTHGARALVDWRRALLIAGLGGHVVLSAQQMALVEVATRTRLYVDHLDAWLMAQRSLINAKKRAAHPILATNLDQHPPTRQALNSGKPKRGPDLLQRLVRSTQVKSP